MSWPNQASEPDDAYAYCPPEYEEYEEYEDVGPGPLPDDPLFRPFEAPEYAWVALAQQTSEDLRWLAEHAGLNETGSINQAVQLYRRIKESTVSDVEIVIRRGDGETEVLEIP